MFARQPLFMTTPNPRSPDLDVPACADAERVWVAGVRAGDPAALEQIFRAHNRCLYRFALSLSGSPDDAEDVVQGVFVAIWEQRATWSVHTGLRVYLFTAVRNRVFQQLRGMRTRDRLQSDVLAFRSRFLAEEGLAPDAWVQHRDCVAALGRAIEALPPRTREAFLLTREHGLTYAEAAATMGIASKTVMTLIGRALATLRKTVGPLLTLLLVVR